MPFIHQHFPPADQTHSHGGPNCVFLIYLALALLRIIYDYLEYREDKVDKYLEHLLDKIDERNRKDLEHLPGGNEYERLQWDWRTAQFYTIPRKAMAYRFWMPMRYSIPLKLRKDLGI